MEEADCIVAGAGVVGLAVARELAGRGHEVLVLEAANAIGTATSSRNSEVIHAGLYYPPGSLKAKLCVAGRAMLYAYCAERDIAHRRCGKLIVASGAEPEKALAAIADNAFASGAGRLQPLGAAEARALEPALFCTAALYSPDTGIVDSHALMVSLLGDAEAGGAMLGLNTKIVSGRLEASRIVLTTRNVESGETFEIATRHFVNATGLGAAALAGALDGLDPHFVPMLRHAKGNYFSVTGRAPFSRLVYPVPEPGGLGIHLTLDLNGIARFGPDVEWVDGLDYTVDPVRGQRFYEAIRAYWPDLPEGALQPAYSGIRPKLAGPGEANADFVIQGPQAHGIAGLVNLFGIESPGLTSCLAIAQHVGRMLA